MEGFETSADGETQYSKEELESFARQGISPDEILSTPSITPKIPVIKKLAQEGRSEVESLRLWTRDRIQQEFSLVDPDIFPPREEEQRYLSFWDYMYCSVIDILKEEDKAKRSQQIFGLISLVDEALEEKPAFLDLHENGYEDLEFLREVFLTGDVNILYAWAQEQAAQEVVRIKGNPKVTYNSPHFPFRKNPYSVDIIEN